MRESVTERERETDRQTDRQTEEMDSKREQEIEGEGGKGEVLCHECTRKKI